MQSATALHDELCLLWRLAILFQHMHQTIDLLSRGFSSLNHVTGFGNRFFQAGLGNRLQYIIQRIYFKSLHGILIVSRNEDKKRQRNFLFYQFFNDAKTIDAGNLHIQENQLGIEITNQADSFHTVLGLRDNFDIRITLQEVHQLIASGLLIVHNQRADFLQDITSLARYAYSISIGFLSPGASGTFSRFCRHRNYSVPTLRPKESCRFPLPSRASNLPLKPLENPI